MWEDEPMKLPCPMRLLAYLGQYLPLEVDLQDLWLRTFKSLSPENFGLAMPDSEGGKVHRKHRMPCYGFLHVKVVPF